MKRLGFLLCCVWLISSMLGIQGATTTLKPGPVITYSCTNKEVKVIHITGGTFDHTRLLRGKEFCEPKPQDDKGVLSCISTLQKSDVVTNVTILYEESNHTGTVGGKIKMFYLLNCDERSTKKTAELVPLNVAPSEFPLTKLGLDISVKPQLSIEHVEGSSADVYVGKLITLQMKIDVKYKLLPTSCSAYRNNNDPSPYKFWNRCDNTNDKAIISNLMWKAVADTQQTIVAIEMYAFRFTKQPAVIIKCETWVCPTGATVCTQSVCPNPVNGRKRRNTNDTMKKNTNVTTATASVALEVFEGIEFRENGSNALSPLWYIYAGGIGIIYWITLKNF